MSPEELEMLVEDRQAVVDVVASFDRGDIPSGVMLLKGRSPEDLARMVLAAAPLVLTLAHYSLEEGEEVMDVVYLATTDLREADESMVERPE